MRFVVDECTGPGVAKWLREQGYDVISIFDEGPGTPDDSVLDRAFEDSRILITNDKDFGEMIFRERRSHHGVVFLRLADERSQNKISVLSELLENYSDRLSENFVTVTETKVRIT